MLLMTVDGENFRELGPGMMPTWSPDGKKIAFSRSGVQVMDLETNEVRALVLNGWSGQWSPTDDRIAFTEGAALKTIDFKTEKVVDVLSAAQSPYQRIFHNHCWSGDGKRICFKGIRANGKAEVASVSTTQPPNLQVHYAGDRFYWCDLAWSPDGAKITFGMATAKSPRMFIHELNPKTNAEPVLLKGLDLTLQSQQSCWSPDGKFLILQTRYD
jgi:Tol biopolymer transport system component